MNIQSFCCTECFHITDNPAWSDFDELVPSTNGDQPMLVHSHHHVALCPRCFNEARTVGPWMEDHPQKVAHAVMRDIGPIPYAPWWRRALRRFINKEGRQ